VFNEKPQPNGWGFGYSSRLAVRVLAAALSTLLPALTGILLLLTGILVLAALLSTLARILALLPALSRAILAGPVLILVHYVLHDGGRVPFRQRARIPDVPRIVENQLSPARGVLPKKKKGLSIGKASFNDAMDFASYWFDDAGGGAGGVLGFPPMPVVVR
jgi:hypothetical protein